MTAVPSREIAFGGPQKIHFAPRRNWMNDPNGLVFHEGTFHMYYQYNPNGSDHGDMSWGHASSTDLITWQEHPVALLHDDEREIYSGSIVWDGEGVAGFGPALIAFYTAHAAQRRHQAQALAYSLDQGLTWTQYEGNPVLDRDSGDFRDPKVLRYRGPAGEYWVMAAVEAADKRVVLYRSDNLLDWDLLSEFDAPQVGEGIWECPDLFPLVVDGEEKWVLIISLGMAPVVAGFGTIYSVGSFDGTTFVAEGDFHRLDHGRDNYAGVTFYGLPDEERTLVAWMGDWIYARELPLIADAPRRGAMTLPRRLSLATANGQTVLRQTPVEPAVQVASEVRGVRVTDPTVVASAPGCCRIDVEVDLGDADGATLRIRHGEDGGGVVLSYEGETGAVRLDRSAVRGFPQSFRAAQVLPTTGGAQLALTIWTDMTSVEIFADGGLSTLTSLVDVPAGEDITVEGIGGEVTVSVTVSVPVS
ncbi:MAG: glycoside hydrolase family 32 protein [Arachnia sp.]